MSFLCGVYNPVDRDRKVHIIDNLEEGDMMVTSIDWMVKEGSKLQNPEAGPSLESAENDLAWLDLLM